MTSYRVISLDTASEDPEFDTDLARIMQGKPTPPTERVKTVRTHAGNIVVPRAR